MMRSGVILMFPLLLGYQYSPLALLGSFILLIGDGQIRVGRDHQDHVPLLIDPSYDTQC